MTPLDKLEAMVLDRNILSEKTILLGVLVITGIVLATISSITVVLDFNYVDATEQAGQTSVSEPHNAKGHQSHQVVNLQNPNEGIVYKGTITFHSSKPVDIIEYEDVTGQQSTNATVNVWEVNGKEYAPKTLMKNVTEGTVNFQGSGIVTHTTASEPYQVTFSTNATAINKGQ